MAAPDSLAAVRRRYRWVASIYDWANLEGLLYADARTTAVELLDLRPGARVLDVACGTGANFELIRRRIGRSGKLVGVDATPQMLDQARARIARAGWDNVYVLEADVCELRPGELGEPFDAALCTLGLSVIPDWQRAWRRMLDCVRPGGRVAVMDAGDPAPGSRRIDKTVPRPMAWALERLFAADCTRRPWRLLEHDTHESTSRTHTWGWVTAAAGTKGDRAMPLTSRAHVPTRTVPQYLAAVCEQLEQRANERPEPDISVEWTETDGAIDLGWARAELRADETGLLRGFHARMRHAR